MKNYFKDKSKTYPRFTLAVGKIHYIQPTIGQTTIQVCTPSVDVNTLSIAGKRKYHSKGINLHMDTSVINSNTSVITSIDVNHISK